ncbi:MAG: GYF domain-containing protein [Verrucomicrobiota bacterium]|nr:GYF domain-containing protein [Verrucomicrobiota bacterium]MEE2813802.1 GYF domain-containing protein [Verrucomicrobiota bacterium]
MMIHVMRDGQQFGPYTLEDLNAYLAQGSLLPTDQAWWEGAPAWVTMDQVPGVQLPGMPMAAPVVEESVADPGVDSAAGSSKKKKIIIIGGAVSAVAVIAGVLLFVWPGFLKDSKGGAEKADGDTPPVGEVVLYEPTIKKIFSEHNCYDCHSSEGGKVKAKLDLDKPDTVTDKIDAFMDSLTAADPDELMPPPDDGTKLNSDELSKVKAWIDGGAKF